MCLVSRPDTFAKLFFIVSFTGLFMYMLLAFYSIQSTFFTKSHTKPIQKKIHVSFPDSDSYSTTIKQVGDQTMKYILLWYKETEGNTIGEGQEPFIRHECMHQNCYITSDKMLLSDYTRFHAIVFNATYMRRWDKTTLPLKRSWDQKYVFFSKDSSERIPICNSQADDYFNWTWTYKLYSDIPSQFFHVKNLKGDVIAPSHDVVWTKYIEEPRDFMKINRGKKNKAIAFIFKNKLCNTAIGFQTKENLKKHVVSFLKDNNLDFDIFGCEKSPCTEKCLRNIKENYFFYWVNDNNIGEDYVTDDILTAIETNTIPVVTGLVDYSRFLPPESYIQVNPLALEDLPMILLYAMENSNAYLDYFRWKQFYTFHRTPYYQGVCQLCSYLNNPTLMKRKTTYKMFRKWWFSGPLEDRCLRRVQKIKYKPEWQKSYLKKKKRKTTTQINRVIPVM